MTDKQIEKIKKYVELIRSATIESSDMENSRERRMRYRYLAEEIILRMEREMKR